MPPYNQAYLDEQARNAAYDASMLASERAPTTDWYDSLLGSQNAPGGDSVLMSLLTGIGQARMLTI